MPGRLKAIKIEALQKKYHQKIFITGSDDFGAPKPEIGQADFCRSVLIYIDLHSKYKGKSMGMHAKGA